MSNHGRRIHILIEEWSKDSLTPFKVLDTKTHNIPQAVADAVTVFYARKYEKPNTLWDAMVSLRYEEDLKRNIPKLEKLLAEAKGE